MVLQSIFFRPFRALCVCAADPGLALRATPWARVLRPFRALVLAMRIRKLREVWVVVMVLREAWRQGEVVMLLLGEAGPQGEVVVMLLREAGPQGEAVVMLLTEAWRQGEVVVML